MTLREHSYGIVPLRRVRGEWQLLLVQHASARYWGFPKGHAEKGESPLQAAQRELGEETGLRIKALLAEEPLSEHYFFRKAGQLVAKTVSYYVAEVTGKVQVQQEEVSEARWVPLDQATQFATYKTDQAVALRAQQFVSDKGH